MPTKIAIASDHAGYSYKNAIIKKYPQIEWEDLGTDSSLACDYPDFGAKMGEAIKNGDVAHGVLICGSGIGISIAANRYPEVRAALCINTEMARLARQHNDANVLALGERVMDINTAYSCVEAFLTSEFEGDRHQARVDKLGEINK